MSDQITRLEDLTLSRAEIEKKIEFVQRQLAAATRPSTMAVLNHCLDKLIMMEASDEHTA